MTSGPVGTKRDWWAKPGIILPLVGTVVVFVALLTPETAQGRFGDSRLSTHVAGSMGARVLGDLATRLGFTVVRRDSEPMPQPGNGRTIHALLAPTERVSREEAHAYLEAVREGDGLLLALSERNALSDSLGVHHYTNGSFLARRDAADVECGDGIDVTPPLWPDGRVHLWGIRWLHEAPPDLVKFAELTGDGGAMPGSGIAAAGFSYGKGRIVVVSDADLLRNDVIRRCAWGVDVVDVRMLEWLRAGEKSPRATIAFDEFHQGYGERASVMKVASTFLFSHPIGRAILQFTLAALLLLLAVAPRALPPRHVDLVERRDPLEQVDALAHAYQQVHATRTIVSRLVRGLRWRVDRGARVGAHPDELFLESAEASRPSLKDDIALVRRALTQSIPERELKEIGAAIRRIELTLTTRVS